MSSPAVTVGVPTDDGTADALISLPAAPGPHPAVLMFSDAFGPRPRIAEMCGRLADAGYAVLAPNLFYRDGPAPLVDLSGLADPERRGETFAELRPLIEALTPELAMRDAAAYVDFLSREPRVLAGPVATVGYCMGGALALRTAATYPDRVAAVASFHGGRLATDRPDSPHLLVDRITAEVYLGHADNDASMPPEAQRTLERALTDAGVRHRSELYAGAAHGFTMADTAMYDEAATQQHWDRLLDLLGRTLPA
jgi:carboxymethylenebutenolidase